jgi:hypothetical protein
MKKILVAVLLIAGITVVAFASFTNNNKKVEKKIEKKECKSKCIYSETFM